MPKTTPIPNQPKRGSQSSTPPRQAEATMEADDEEDDELPEAQEGDRGVLGYGAMVDAVHEQTGLRKADIRKVLDMTQRVIAGHCREKVGNRAHLGRLCTFYSTQTKDRIVNDPRQKGGRLTSPAHIAIRFQPGTHAKQYMKGDRDTWDSRGDADGE